MSQITTQHVKLDGTAPTFAAAAASDTAECGSGLKLIVKNGSDASVNVTLTVPGKQVGGADNDDVVYAVAALADTVPGERWIPLYDFYKDPTDGLAHIAYSATTTVTRAVVKG